MSITSQQEYAILPHLPSIDILLESEEALTVYIAGSLFLSKYLYSDTTSATHLQVSGQQAVQKLVEIEFGDEGQNCQITITTNFPCYLYGTVRAGN